MSRTKTKLTTIVNTVGAAALIGIPTLNGIQTYKENTRPETKPVVTIGAHHVTGAAIVFGSNADDAFVSAAKVAGRDAAVILPLWGLTFVGARALRRRDPDEDGTKATGAQTP